MLILGVLILCLSGWFTQPTTEFGWGILILSLFALVPGIALAGAGLILRRRTR